MRGLQKFQPLGKMDKDTDPVYIDKIDYRDANNISHITDSTGSTQAIIPMKGNTAAFDLGSIAVQNKTYRLYTSDTTASPEPSNAQLTFLSNGIQFGAPLGATATYLVSWSRNQPVSGQAASIKTQINVWDTNATVTAGATYVDITLSLISGGEFTISPLDGQATPVAMLFNTYKEAYDTTMVGEMQAIGSYDLLGDLYVWSTTGVNLPLKKTLTVSSVSLFNVAGRFLYDITFTTAHGLSAGQSVNFVGSTTSGLDGEWVVSSLGVSSTRVILDDYFSKTLSGFTPPSTIDVTLYTNSIGEIGVGQYNDNTDLWTYTRLGRTKQWGFRTKKQPDTYCEQNSVRSSIYWTDDFNVPRDLYYIKEYDVNNNLLPFYRGSPTLGDGVITTINSTGIYTYETIEQESRLQINEGISNLSFSEQLQSGGAVPSGNWRYSTQFLTESLTATAPSVVSNPVNVYLAASNGDASLIIGDQPGTVTGKINKFELTGILPGLFKYVELIGINYIGSAVAGYIIKRELLNDTQTSITLSHTGNETGIVDYDLGLLNQQFEEIETAKNIDVIDKRMILSNLTTKAKSDFTSWAQTFTHSVLRKTIDSVRDNEANTLRIGEYQDPANVNANMGLMHNETYRYSVRGHYLKGGYSENFQIDDIIVDCSATNSAGTDPTRRVAGLTDFNLTNGAFPPASTVDDVYVPYINFSNINFDFEIDGVPVRQIFDFIEIERAEVETPTILACGIAVPSLVASAASFVLNSGANYLGRYGTLAVPAMGEFPFISGRTLAGVTLGNPAYDNPEFNIVGRDRQVISFYSPDVQFGHKTISRIAGDVMINHGNPSYVAFNNGYTSVAASNVASNYSQYSGFTGSSLANPPINIPIAEVVDVLLGASVTLASLKVYRKQMALVSASGPAGTYSVNSIRGSLVMEATSGTFTTLPGQTNDGGFYYNQYYRPTSDQYGATTLTKYISCGHRLTITPAATGAQNTDVFGGDTFTQLNYFKHRLPSEDDIQFPGLVAPIAPLTGFAGGVAYYSQNRINVQMKEKSASQTGNLYPGIETDLWLTSSSNTDSTFGESYQEGYTIRNEVQSHISFNGALENNNDFPSRIRWSAIKPQGSPSDQYRVFLPLDFHDLDQTNGEIVHHANGNGELITWQQRAFMRQYFNTRGTLEVKGISEVLIGDGSVMSRDGVTVSRLGSKHKWAIIKGKSNGGNDVFYWINTEIKKALRFGYDGTVSIADIKGMQSFVANNVKWVNDKDTPADGEGICGFWDDRYGNAGWTVKGRIKEAQSFGDYNAALGYTTGDKVFYKDNVFNSFGGVYISIDTNINQGNQPDLFPAKWELQADDGTYFNSYTLLFNEFKNAFTSFTTPTPNIYLKWADTYLSARPVSPVYKIYQHNIGDYLTWYAHSGVSQTALGYIEWVVNEIDGETKWYEAIGIDSEIVPTRLDFTTKNQVSFLLGSEFETREDSSYAPIKNDSTTTGINDGDTSSLYGKYMFAKMSFDVAVYQKLVNATVKFIVSPRYKSK